MSDENKEFGDEKFKEYMNKINSNPGDGDSLSVILSAIKFKIKSIYELFSKTIDAYQLLQFDDPLKEKLDKFMSQLIKHSLETLDQFSYILMDFEDEPETGTDKDIDESPDKS